VGKACRLMWRLVWSPKASSKCLISQAVAVVEVKICSGVYGDNTVVIEGSQRGSMGLLLSTDLHTVTMSKTRDCEPPHARHTSPVATKRLPAASGPIDRGDWPEGGSRQFSWVKHLPPAFLIRLQSPLASSGDSGPTCAA